MRVGGLAGDRRSPLIGRAHHFLEDRMDDALGFQVLVDATDRTRESTHAGLAVAGVDRARCARLLRWLRVNIVALYRIRT